MNKTTCSKMSAVWAIVQGVSTALVPRLTVVVIPRMLGTNFENAADTDETETVTTCER